MTTVASRMVRSSPHRDTTKTWETIVDLLVRQSKAAAREELLAVTGVVASLIADRAPADSAIVVSGDGPRTRIYCLYDEDAIDGSDAKEDSLGYDALQGDWRISFPCPADDLSWVTQSLASKTNRITVRDMTQTLREDVASDSQFTPQSGSIDLEAFLKS